MIRAISDKIDSVNDIHPVRATRWYLDVDGRGTLAWAAETSEGIMPYHKITLSQVTPTDLFEIEINPIYAGFDLPTIPDTIMDTYIQLVTKDIPEDITLFNTEHLFDYIHVWNVCNDFNKTLKPTWAVRYIPLASNIDKNDKEKLCVHLSTLLPALRYNTDVPNSLLQLLAPRIDIKEAHPTMPTRWYISSTFDSENLIWVAEREGAENVPYHKIVIDNCVPTISEVYTPESNGHFSTYGKFTLHNIDTTPVNEIAKTIFDLNATHIWRIDPSLVPEDVSDSWALQYVTDNSEAKIYHDERKLGLEEFSNVSELFDININERWTDPTTFGYDIGQPLITLFVTNMYDLTTWMDEHKDNRHIWYMDPKFSNAYKNIWAIELVPKSGKYNDTFYRGHISPLSVPFKPVHF